jgi:hypothetical protein
MAQKCVEFITKNLCNDDVSCFADSAGKDAREL